MTDKPRNSQTRLRRAIGKRRWLVLGVTGAFAIAGCGTAAAIGTSTTSKSSTPTVTASAAAASTGAASGSNARSVNAEGGAVGTVSGLTSTGFTLTTPTGAKYTVKVSSSTTYEKGAVKDTGTALVLGKVNNTTITAVQITADPSINLKKASSSVLAFQQGSQSADKSVGSIPTDYTEGQGTIMKGTTANKAATAALSSYAGGIVDRVVKLANGEYEVHYIGVNWPHHIFVSKSFKVVGAD
jgi:hypothetical protein